MLGDKKQKKSVRFWNHSTTLVSLNLNAKHTNRLYFIYLFILIDRITFNKLFVSGVYSEKQLRPNL